jgi:hypothetical protein
MDPPQISLHLTQCICHSWIWGSYSRGDTQIFGDLIPYWLVNMYNCFGRGGGAASTFKVEESKKKTTPKIEEAHSPQTQADWNLHTSVASLSSPVTTWKGISTGMAFLFLSTTVQLPTPKSHSLLGQCCQPMTAFGTNSLEGSAIPPYILTYVWWWKRKKLQKCICATGRDKILLFS